MKSNFEQHNNNIFLDNFLSSFYFLLKADDLMKAYPGFVNYFEIIKETIIRCDKEKPRFHAFLKVYYVLYIIFYCLQF